MKSKHAQCKKIFHYICDNLDQNIDSSRCREIKKHLNACPNCTVYLDSLKKAIHLYREYPKTVLTNKSRRKLYKTLRLHLAKPLS
jgi:predicted anti-sigma-YlaC factor YlaD